jgi:hypothetical protein
MFSSLIVARFANHEVDNGSSAIKLLAAVHGTGV